MGQAIFIFGPAGSGKTTFTKNLLEHGRCTNRSFGIVNLDPAQISSDVEYTIDVRDYITVNDVMEECDLGPNGGLMLALEELWENIEEFDLDTLSGSYLLFDCPGQLELFMHSDVMNNIIDYVKQYFSCGILYLLEAQYIMDINKFIGGCLCSCISSFRFNLPVFNVLTKVDLVDENRLQKFLDVDEEILEELKDNKFGKLNRKIFEFLEENNLSKFTPLDWRNEESLEAILYNMDTCLQYFEDLEPIEMKD
ncbi:GPN-loop GTPase 3 [Nosema granulosis]|uniref:GPN-loop GTPase 3 n=1 Tax=Nosema granulosis TaxID=83296 RepID=A0A9P6H133_9MICR|nr:GPN-loop GTPase 3 [Nosema granulosis]